MVQREFTFPSADGKTDIHAVEWLPEVPPRAVLQISHGVSEHIARYAPLARFLTGHGLAVVGHDHLGHGRSVAPGAPRLYFGEQGSWMYLVADLERRRSLARELYPQAPCFLLGHSMGSFLARTYLIRYPGRISGAILVGTGQPAPALTAAGRLIAAAECLRLGADHPSTLADRAAFGAYNRRFAPCRTGYDWLSRNPENVDDYLADPLCGGTATAGLFREMLAGVRLMEDPAQLRRMDRALPVLFLSGAMDPVGSFGKGVERAAKSFRAAGMRDVTVHLYPELRHELLNEACREDIYQDLLDWIFQKLADAG